MIYVLWKKQKMASTKHKSGSWAAQVPDRLRIHTEKISTPNRFPKLQQKGNFRNLPYVNERDRVDALSGIERHE